MASTPSAHATTPGHQGGRASRAAAVSSVMVPVQPANRRRDSMPELRTVMTGLVIGESPRWHQGRLWFSHWGAQEIIAIDVQGNSEVVAQGPPGLGWSIDWLPDGRLLVTGQQLLRREADGSLVTHADLSGLSDGWNVIVAESFAGRLTAFDVAADGSLSNRRAWAEGLAPDGICIDAEGAVWTSTGKNDCARVGEGGEILQRIELDRSPFACMLGGEDRTTLFMLAVEWRTQESVPDNLLRLTSGPRTGQVLAAPAPRPRRRLAWLSIRIHA